MLSPLDTYRPTVRAARAAVRAGTPVPAVVDRLHRLALGARYRSFAYDRLDSPPSRDHWSLNCMLSAYAEGFEDGYGQ
jgi:hypothetical protein